MTLLVFTPNYPPTVTVTKPEVKLLEAEFGDGYTQAAPDGINHIRRVANLSWDYLTAISAQSFDDFFALHGGYKPFWFILSDTGEMVKWTCKEWQRTRGTPNKYECTFRESFILT
jgi:phage-related protein